MAEALPPLHSWEAYFTPTNRFRERAELGIAGYGHRSLTDSVEVELLTGCTLEELLAAIGTTWETFHTFARPRTIIWTGHNDWMTTAYDIYDGHRSTSKYRVEHSSTNSVFLHLDVRTSHRRLSRWPNGEKRAA
jgi:hypothetical protein